MQEHPNKLLVRRYIEEMWNRGNLDAAAELLTPDYTRHMPDGALDAAGQKRRIAGMREAFADLRMDIRQLVAEGDRVAVHLQMTGTHRAPFLGAAPSGRAVEMTAVDIVRVAGGRIAEHWGAADMLGLSRQIGATPQA